MPACFLPRAALLLAAADVDQSLKSFAKRAGEACLAFHMAVHRIVGQTNPSNKAFLLLTLEKYLLGAAGQ